ncbi:homoserine dehydrogenase [Kordiimonas sp. SCSIO 12610]|nr:homoserine dehydrogenase [Kordiimonas sp. SCSIO 12610]
MKASSSPLRTGPLRIGIAGLGTVGVGVIKILEERKDILSAHTGQALEITTVSARDRRRDRGVDLSGYDWCDNTVELAERDNVDMVIELIGGSDGPAYALAKETLKRGKAFITANKALVAVHGRELAELAEANNAYLRFEAAVAGGIPIIKALREGLIGNEISSIQGILNGTCNYILTRMENEGLDFDVILEEAQKIGYAEADPTFDIEGIDTAHKTAILAALAYGYAPDITNLPTEGITKIGTVDIDYARQLGYRIKLLGIARKSEKGIETRVYPAMVPLDSAIAKVAGATNAVVVEGSYVGQTVYEGAGAGEGPTASAVVADIMDVVRGNAGPVFGLPSHTLAQSDSVSENDYSGTFYVRLRVDDEPGVMAHITAVLAEEKVSIGSLLQLGSAVSGGVYIVMTTHVTSEDSILAALKHFTELECVLETPTMLRIEAC